MNSQAPVLTRTRWVDTREVASHRWLVEIRGDDTAGSPRTIERHTMHASRTGWAALDDLDAQLRTRGYVRSGNWQPGEVIGYVAWVERVEVDRDRSAERAADAKPSRATAAGRGRSLEQFAAEFTVYSTARGHRERTIANRLELLRRTLARAGHRTINELTHADLIAHLGRGVAPASVQRERADLQALFRFAVEAGYRADDPSATLPRVTVRKGRPRPFTVEQISAMLATGSYRRTRVMILLGYLQGLRAHEIAKIHGGDLDIAGGALRVEGKGGSVRVLPLHPLIAAEAESMPRNGYWFPARAGKPGHIHSKSVSDLMTDAKRRAGITDPDLTGHSLRHSYGTHLVRSGADLRTAQELLGHASLATTQIYTGIDEAQLAAAVRKLPAPAVPTRAGR